ncbi:MAG: hypothetical protein K2N26_00185 [Oscillospiraceae bacterium]|nr:hypothetical protein [Oscillospiraceae bacterium]
MTKKTRILILTIAALITFISAAFIIFLRHYYYGWLDKESKTDIFFGQSAGVCTHDESYTEPIMPNGRYYPGGDVFAPYYVEITENRFCQLKASDGKIETIVMIAYENNQIRNNIDEKKEFKVITHHFKDSVFFCTDWEEIRRFDLNDYRGEILPAEIRNRDESDDFLWETNEYRGEKLMMRGSGGAVITDTNNSVIGFSSPEYSISPDYESDFIYCDEY